MWRMIQLISAMTVTALGAPVWAQTDAAGDSSVNDMLKAMQGEIEKLRGENQQMRGEIDVLNAQNDDHWLTEARAEQIRGLVQDVIADADTRASLLQDGMIAGWSEHFFLNSPDGRFNLTFEGLMQIRFVYNYHDVPDHHRYGFENTRTWLTFRGHVFTPDLTYLVRGDFSRNGGGESLLDAWVRYNFDDSWSLRFGQFKLPFMREELVYDGYQQAVERTLINELNSLKRSQGVELTYGAEFDRVATAFSDGGSAQLAALNQARQNSPALNEDTEWAVTTRYEHLFAGTWDQFTDFTSPRGEEFGMLLGVAGHAQQSESNGMFSFGDRNETPWYGYTVDLSIEWGGANAFLAWIHHYVDSPNVHVNFYNVVAQAGYYLMPKWEVFARVEYAWVKLSLDQEFEDLIVIGCGTTYFIEGHDVKWTTDIGMGINRVENFYMSDLAGWRTDPAGTSAEPQVVFRTQFQLLF